MRPRHEWCKPDQLRRYYFAYEAVALAVVRLVNAGAMLGELRRIRELLEQGRTTE